MAWCGTLRMLQQQEKAVVTTEHERACFEREESATRVHRWSMSPVFPVPERQEVLSMGKDGTQGSIHLPPSWSLQRPRQSAAGAQTVKMRSRGTVEDEAPGRVKDRGQDMGERQEEKLERQRIAQATLMKLDFFPREQRPMSRR